MRSDWVNKHNRRQRVPAFCSFTHQRSSSDQSFRDPVATLSLLSPYRSPALSTLLQKKKTRPVIPTTANHFGSRDTGRQPPRQHFLCYLPFLSSTSFSSSYYVLTCAILVVQHYPKASPASFHSCVRTVGNTEIRFSSPPPHLQPDDSISRATIPPWVARRFRSRLFWTSATDRYRPSYHKGSHRRVLCSCAHDETKLGRKQKGDLGLSSEFEVERDRREGEKMMMRERRRREREGMT